mgnify:CR=1 FL=1
MANRGRPRKLRTDEERKAMARARAKKNYQVSKLRAWYGTGMNFALETHAREGLFCQPALLTG